MEGIMSAALTAAETAIKYGNPTGFAWLRTVRDIRRLAGLMLHWRLQQYLQVRPPLPSNSLWEYYAAEDCRVCWEVAAARVLLLLLLEPKLLQHIKVYRQICMRMHKQMGMLLLLASPLRLLSAALLLYDLLPNTLWPLTHLLLYKIRCIRCS